jgi:hypothetical protein
MPSKGTIHIIFLAQNPFIGYCSAVGWQINKLQVLFLMRGSYSWLVVFRHWGGSKLERALKMEIVSSTWDDKECTKLFGKC